MTERILVSIEVPRSNLQELEDGVEKGDPIANYIYRSDIRIAEGILKGYGFLKPGDDYRITFVESDVLTDDEARRVKVSIPVLNSKGVQVDVEVKHLSVEIEDTRNN